MLNRITIKNFALIDKTEIDFSRGLNILSGETGSGKSIILEALNFVLGAKADKDLIKNGETECVVSAEFDIENNSIVKDILRSFDFEEEDALLITRKFTIEGKSSIKVNGNGLTVTMLKNISHHLVDIHGQSDHFYLLSLSNQLELIDKFSGEKVCNIKSELSKEIDVYKGISDEIKSLGGSEKERLTKIDILSYQIDEISKANLIEGEEEELSEKKKQLLNKEKIISALSGTSEAINGEGGVCDVLSNLSKMLSGISEFSKEYGEISDRLNSALTEIEDISSSSESMLDCIDEEDVSIDQIEDRLQLIKNLKRKYGNSIEEVLIFLNDAKKEKANLENFNELYGDLLLKQQKQEKIIEKLYNVLHMEREKTSKILIGNVQRELKELGFLNSEFAVRFGNGETVTSYTSKNGNDEVEFLFSANVGEPLKPLSTVISGGEISRFMLALKAQLSKYSDIGVYVFDEIDSGISGQIAKVVAQKFYSISKSTQIIAITHLPQIAVMGDSNYLIYKYVDSGKTYSKIKLLENEERNKEIVRLIGGDSNSKNALELAKELLDEANNYKKTV